MKNKTFKRTVTLIMSLVMISLSLSACTVDMSNVPPQYEKAAVAIAEEFEGKDIEDMSDEEIDKALERIMTNEDVNAALESMMSDEEVSSLIDELLPEGVSLPGADEIAGTDEAKGTDEPIGTDEGLKDLPIECDHTEIYEDFDAFVKDIDRIMELIPSLEKHKGKLNSVEGILNFLEDPEYLEMTETINKAVLYTSIRTRIDMTDREAKQAALKVNEVKSIVNEALIFVDKEIMALPYEERVKIINDERLDDYSYLSQNYLDPDHELLSDDTKKTLNNVTDLLGMAQTTRDIFDHTERPLPKITLSSGEEVELTDSMFAMLINDSEFTQADRRKLFELRNSSRIAYAGTYATLLEGYIRGQVDKARIMGYDSALENALKEENIDPAVYGKVIEFAHSMFPQVHRYYKMRKELSGLDTYYYSDLTVPCTDYTPKEIKYEDLVNIGREVVKVWGDEYLETFDEIVTSPHISVYPGPLKATGTYEINSMVKGIKPYVLLNFTGRENYLTAFVHEMGHAVYSDLSVENQNLFNNSPGSFTQEVASTSNEIMLYRYMKENAKDKDEKLYWLSMEIEYFMATLMRQCMYAEFEDYCYKVVESGGILDKSDLSSKWLELMSEYYGDDVVIDESQGIDWARIQHFYLGYYVYNYATSITYATSVCNMVERDGQEETDKYIEFLKAGSSADPVTLLGIAGVDPLSDSTYEEAGEYLSGLIDEFDELISE
ncbi:MAG: hypothetical protein K6B28_11855 [Lachnospiraceae bacterium]|nr:hypothetical protein [Lachnospiraceae bacterium]